MYGVCLCSVLLHDVCIGFVAVAHTSHGVYAIYLHGLAHAYQLYTRTTAIQHVCTHAHNHTYNNINLSLHPSSAPRQPRPILTAAYKFTRQSAFSIHTTTPQLPNHPVSQPVSKSPSTLTNRIGIEGQPTIHTARHSTNQSAATT